MISRLQKAIKGLGFLAGGVCRSIEAVEDIKDYDVFCFEYGSFDELVANILLEFDEYEVTKENDLVVQIGSIQVIKPRENKYLRTWGNPIDVVERFDFSVCKAYLDENTRVIPVSSDFYKHIESKTLSIENIVCPISTFRRSLKYATKGYFLPLSEIFKLYEEYNERALREEYDDFFREIADNDSDLDIYELMSIYGID